MTDEENKQTIKNFIDLLDTANHLQGECKERQRILINLSREFSSDIEIALRQTIGYYSY